MNALLNPAYQPSAEVIDEILRAAASARKQGNGDLMASGDDDTWQDGISHLQEWLSFIAQHVSLPRQRRAVLQASLTEWAQVQHDFQRVLSLLSAIGQIGGISAADFGPFRFNIVQLLGTLFIQVDLALRLAGYTDTIERGLSYVESLITQADQRRMQGGDSELPT